MCEFDACPLDIPRKANQYGQETCFAGSSAFSTAARFATTRDIDHYPFPKAQAELRETLRVIINDAATADVAGLRASHLKSDKFTKFGPRRFARQDVEQCNESEAAFFTSIQDFESEVKNLKIDVFGEVAIMTYYPHVSFKKDGEIRKGSSRQTLVFLKTDDGWKIVHEHGTPKSCFENGVR